MSDRMSALSLERYWIWRYLRDCTKVETRTGLVYNPGASSIQEILQYPGNFNKFHVNMYLIPYWQQKGNLTYVE